MATQLAAVAKVVAQGTFNAEKFVNVFHFGNRTTTFDPTSLQTLLTALNGASGDKTLKRLYAEMDTGLNVATLTATQVLDSAPYQVSNSVNISGTSAGTDMPPMLAAVMKWGTGLGDRHFRGRTYMCGLNAGFIDSSNSDRLPSSVQANLASAAQAFATAWHGDASFEFLVLSETLRQADFVNPTAEILTGSVNPLVCEQRRRRERI